jgi:hypothetical protein
MRGRSVSIDRPATGSEFPALYPQPPLAQRGGVEELPVRHQMKMRRNNRKKADRGVDFRSGENEVRGRKNGKA